MKFICDISRLTFVDDYPIICPYDTFIFNCDSPEQLHLCALNKYKEYLTELYSSILTTSFNIDIFDTYGSCIVRVSDTNTLQDKKRRIRYFISNIRQFDDTNNTNIKHYDILN